MTGSRRFGLHEIGKKIREMTDAEDVAKRALTLLSDEFNQGDESNVRWGSHGVAQQDSTESDAVFVTEDDGASCT